MSHLTSGQLCGIASHRSNINMVLIVHIYHYHELDASPTTVLCLASTRLLSASETSIQSHCFHACNHASSFRAALLVSRLLLRRQDGLVTAAQGSTSTVSRSSRSNSSRGLVDLSGTLHNPGTVHADRGPGRGGFPSAPLSSIYHMIVKNEGPLTEASIRLNTERQLTRAHGPLVASSGCFHPRGPFAARVRCTRIVH